MRELGFEGRTLSIGEGINYRLFIFLKNFLDISNLKSDVISSLLATY